MADRAHDYRPGHRGHRCLQRLARGPATLAQLRHTVSGHEDAQRRGQIWHIVQALEADGLAEKTGPSWRLTQAGEAELDRLDRLEQQRTLGVPSARIFAREAAHG